MENTQIKLSETVMVIDVAYLNFVINDLRKYFGSAEISGW